ncbi:ABC transporter permease [Halomonas denitrificans]|uniref:ABC transporter permease n=1 Tax=Halomonas denitrificans TaxID=370769 RepID=UPI001CD401B0|nr:ABC transporter permease [Halomonas denitrificans]MCA0974369.1 ABC transporter permease [Halomonas denitrificans]
MQPLMIIACKEFRDGLRHRWVLGIAVLLGVLAMGIAAFGAAASGGRGFTELPTTLISLSTLAMLLIPLIALLLAYDAIVGEDEGGTLLLLATYPISRHTWLLGKYLGHAWVLGLATTIGFAVAGIVIAIGTPQAALMDTLLGLATLIASSLLMGWSFLAMAYWISAGASSKQAAAAQVLVAWFLFVLVLDLALLALLVMVRQGGSWLPWLMLANPAECFRLLVLATLDATHAADLPALAGVATRSPAVLVSVLIAWIVVPLSLAARRFAKRSL